MIFGYKKILYVFLLSKTEHMEKKYVMFLGCFRWVYRLCLFCLLRYDDSDDIWWGYQQYRLVISFSLLSVMYDDDNHREKAEAKTNAKHQTNHAMVVVYWNNTWKKSFFFHWEKKRCFFPEEYKNCVWFIREWMKIEWIDADLWNKIFSI